MADDRGGLPSSIVRLTSAPQRLAVVWASRDVDALLSVLTSIGLVAVKLEPADTGDFLAVSGAPSMLVVESDLIDDDLLAVINRMRDTAGTLSVAVLAGADSHAAGLLRAMRAGLTDVVDPSEPEQIPATLGLAKGGSTRERVLAVGAHPDDVEIGCGATLLRHRNLGDPITALTLSQGAVGGVQRTRCREASAAAIAMSAELLMGDLPDTRMGEADDMVTLIEEVIAVVNPTTVYVHSAADNHQDHRAVHDATMIATRRVQQVFCYQSPSSRNGFAPTKFVPVDDTIDEKVTVLANYRSQSTRHYLEPDLVVATSRYWARQLPHTRYAEPFEVIRATEPNHIAQSP
ncbi:MAG TPA: PIG-L deacetylase family protein [Mycobacterium sp.]|nr:PIG-L deacetylase family protein [Mycobacterium sp.]